MIRALGVAVLVSLAACSRSPAPSSPGATPAPAPTATDATTAAAPSASTTPPAAASAPPPAGEAAAQPAGPIPVPITTSVARAGETSTPLSFNETTVVDPTARFHVEAAVALTDARLSLVDRDDAMIAGEESHEIGATWSRFVIAPDAPLRPGSTYTLRLDGAAEREAHDSNGRAYQVATWTIKVAGEPPPPEKPAPTKGKRR